MTPNFLTTLKAGFPSGVSLPREIEMAVAWLEARGCVHRYNNAAAASYATLYPGKAWSDGASLVTFEEVAPDFVRLYTKNDAPDPSTRLAMFVRSGGDGSRAGLWRDDAGRQHFVHCGSGSGSTLLGILTSDPVDFLRLLAIGYEELCWPDAFPLTPAAARGRDAAFGKSILSRPPVEFGNWVAETFGVRIPDRASDIVAQAPDMMDKSSNDPFWQWVTGLSR